MSGTQSNISSDAYWVNQLSEVNQQNAVLQQRIHDLTAQNTTLRVARDRKNLDGQRLNRSVGSMVARFENMSEVSAAMTATNTSSGRATADPFSPATTATTVTQSPQQVAEQVAAENEKLRAQLAIHTTPIEVPSTRLATISETAEASQKAVLTPLLWQRSVVVDKKPQVNEHGFWARVD